MLMIQKDVQNKKMAILYLELSWEGWIRGISIATDVVIAAI